MRWQRGFTGMRGKILSCPFSKCLMFTGMSKVLSLFSGARAQLHAVANSPLSLAQGSVMWTLGCFHTGPPCTGVVSLVPHHLGATKHLLIPPKALWLTETNSPLKIELMQCDDSETSRDFLFVCCEPQMVLPEVYLGSSCKLWSQILTVLIFGA